MNAFGIASYGIAALSFLVLTLLLVTAWRGRQQGGHLIVASAVTAVWAGILAAQSYAGHVPVLVIYLAEAFRGGAWLLTLVAVAGIAAPKFLANAARGLCVLLLGAAVVLPLLEHFGIAIVNPTLLLSRAGLALSLLALILLEQIYRNSSQLARRSLKYFIIGVGTLFAYDLFLYSQTELLRAVSIDAWTSRGILNAFAMPLIAIAARRNPEWSLDVFVSRQIVFYTTTVLVIGSYLSVMALGGLYVREIGGDWGNVGQIVFFAGAVVVLASLVTSAPLRRHTRVFISKHFYRNKYDYRIEWLRFIGTLSSTEEEDVGCTAVRAMAQIFGSPGGFLFLRDETGKKFLPYAAWPMTIDSLGLPASVSADEDLPQFLATKQWIIDTDEFRRAPDFYGNIEMPGWLLDKQQLRIVSPMLQLDRLVGFVVLYDPPPPFELTYEDRDLLKTLGRHVATHIAQQDADRRLSESRQFEAYNRLTAFMMHDLKNSVAQLKLIVANAPRHKHKPEFIDDALETIANAADRMTKLIEQLRGSTSADRHVPADLRELAQKAVSRCSSRAPKPQLQEGPPVMVMANAERLSVVIEHIIRNAQDATSEGGAVSVSVGWQGREARLLVEDTGVGMEADFIRNRLFRPFDSTKGAKGMGIGAYQVREYIRLLGGDVEVQSSPGQGTRFAVSLPLAQGQDATAASNAVNS
ncbi:histidine kinase [Steroidobacter agaridevorans]|uniref:histidine kinase n=1 Tax=Steroidobacter agaridevorans TaxID=2695856 RepID=A0A829YFE0_9GAMM|nr:XrtA/PEP-CTERM system histidine kinase PrsK [Steroidobacter agaridevorans]GFE82135.1 histidine kinase [Steroidobacter agaridevorans]GFE85477.1 histidine kinase [Steroidobacter agaridevorans]